MGAAMGWTAQQVRAASMWQFFAALNGFIAANTPKEASGLTESQKDELWADIEAYGTGDGRTLTKTLYELDGLVLKPSGSVRFVA